MSMCYQRETKLKAVEKKHIGRLSQSISKKQSTKAVEKKPAKKTKRSVNGNEAKSQSQARKNQSEKKYRKVYGENGLDEFEEELAQENAAEKF
jgi:hypothetical protein